MTRRLLAAGAVLAALVLLLPGAASARTLWLCGPGVAHDPCRPSLSRTVVTSWGASGQLSRPALARRPPIDCFYVYPTASNQPTTVARRRADPELRSIALFQAAAYSQLCRVYAPLYRQITVPGLNRGDATAAQRALAYGDVVAAWKAFLHRTGPHRGVVVIGHSQGAGILERLLHDHVDGNPAVRRRLLSAILLGGNVPVLRGQDAGGIFQHIPACRSAAQLGCVIAFSTFDAPPPANALFGRYDARFARFFGLKATGDLEVLCTNPAQLAGGDDVPLDPVFAARTFAPSYIGAGFTLSRFPIPPVPTTFLEAPGSFTGHCADVDGANVLLVTPQAGVPVPQASPTPGWGLHLYDANIALGDLLRVVGAEAGAYAARG